MNIQEVQGVAIAEILHPTLALTEQYLATNKIVIKDGTPIVEDIIFQEEEKAAYVYFRIEGEYYYFVIVVDVASQLSLRWVGTSPGSSVYLIVKSEKYSLNELTALAGVAPTRTWEKGASMTQSGRKTRKAYQHSGFEVQIFPKKTGTVEDKLSVLTKTLLLHKDNLRTLGTMAYVAVHIAYWGYKAEMWGINFTTEALQALAELNLSVDVDLYAGGPDLVEG